VTYAAVLGVAQRLEADWLAPALEPLAQSVWPDVAWRFSRLTADGCPVEIGFSSEVAAVRATLEVAGPECSNHGRVDAACRLLCKLGLATPDPTLVASWRTMQAPVALRWGCWLGLRSARGQVGGKMYIELPRDDPAPWAGARSKMLGYDPVTRASEHYAALIEPTEVSLRSLLGPLGAPMRRQLLERLIELTGLPMPTLLRWIGLGASITEADQVALFFRARALRGGPSRLRALFESQPKYRLLFGACAATMLPDHGVVTLLPNPSGTLELRCGISAVACACAI
jgi:hypothetical protein